MAFKDPIDEEADAAESAVVGKHASELAGKVKAAREVDTEEIEVQEPDDDEEEEAAAKTRSEKRSERGRDRLSSRERAAAAEARAELLAQQLEESKRTRVVEQPVQQNNEQVARLEKRYGDVVAEQERLFNEYQRATNLTPQQEAEFRRRASVLDLQKTNAALEIREAYTAPQRAREEKGRMLAARAPDVYGNERALAYAAGEFQKRLAMGEADTTELHDLVCEEARQVVLGKRPPPDASQRARATGMSSGIRPSQAGSAVKLSMPRGSAMYRMAIAMYPGDEPGVACQKWANKHGKAFSESVKSRA